MAAGAVLFWPDPVPAFDPQKAVAFATALAIWLFAEFFPSGDRSKDVSGQPKAVLDEHDSALGARLAGVANDEFIQFLRKHDFGGSFWQEQIEPLFKLDDLLQKNSSAFNEEKLQSELAKVKPLTRELVHQVACGAGLKQGRDRLFTMVPDNEPDGLWSAETVKRVQAANDKADEVANALSTMLAALRMQGLVLAPHP